MTPFAAPAQPSTVTPRPAAAPAPAAPAPAAATLPTDLTGTGPRTAADLRPEPIEAPPPPLRTLTPAAVAALPFAVDLPAGFTVTTNHSGGDVNVYAIRKGDTPFVMVETGPSSMFPIYDGQQVEAGGRTSIVNQDGTARHAVEHLFQRATAPREIHVWVASVAPADQAEAERIAQTVDPR